MAQIRGQDKEKQPYLKDEPMQIEVYMINEGSERVVLDEGARLIVQVLDVNRKGEFDYILSTEDSMFNSDANETITIEPRSEVLLSQAFQRDQKTFIDFDYYDSPLCIAWQTIPIRFPHTFQATKAMSFFYHDKRNQIGSGNPSDDHERGEFNDITITIPQDASGSGYDGPYYISEIESVLPGT